MRWMQALRRLILRVMRPINYHIGFIYLSWHHKKFTHRMISEIESCIEPGDVIITRTEGEMTNMFIPGFWSHAAIYVGGGIIIEAVGRGVVETDIYDFFMAKDYANILNPKFAPRDHKICAAEWAVAAKGSPYDYGFEPGEDAFYCAELVAWVYQKAFDGESPFVQRKTMGVETVTPQDFDNAKDKFESKWCNREY